MIISYTSIVFLIALSFVVGSCSKKDSGTIITPQDTIKKTDTVAIGSYPSITNDTNTFHNGVQLGTVNDDLIHAASGLAASRAYPNMFWTHNDAGTYDNIFLLDSTGKRRAYFLVMNASNHDWTDMAIGPGPISGRTYIYLADVGDSKNFRSSVRVYRVPEPHNPIDTSGAMGQTENAAFITFRYPDGPHDAETILFDATTKDIYIIDKNTPASVYIAHYPQPVDSFFMITKIATIPLSSLRGGSMSSDGQEILVKNLGTIYYWKRKSHESVLSALLRSPMIEPYIPEAHGEAICWSESSDAYYTTSKLANGIIPDFTVYRRK